MAQFDGNAGAARFHDEALQVVDAADLAGLAWLAWRALAGRVGGGARAGRPGRACRSLARPVRGRVGQQGLAAGRQVNRARGAEQVFRECIEFELGWLPLPGAILVLVFVAKNLVRIMAAPARAQRQPRGGGRREQARGRRAMRMAARRMDGLVVGQHCLAGVGRGGGAGRDAGSGRPRRGKPAAGRPVGRRAGARGAAPLRCGRRWRAAVPRQVSQRRERVAGMADRGRRRRRMARRRGRRRAGRLTRDCRRRARPQAVHGRHPDSF